ncbi:MAG: M20/M25/M40 family metallo-hydrolase [Thermodesulfobacteriota bacterium]
MQATIDLAVRLAGDLITIPSESSDPVASDADNPEDRVGAYLRRVCGEHRLQAEMQAVTARRHNLVIRLPRPEAAKIVIAGHMDTVSARGMAEPFAAARRDGRLWGRGACDDKGPLAVALACLLHVARTGCPYDVTLVATVDEECSLGGAAAYARETPPFDLAIALEPTSLRIVRAHKGVMRLSLETTGVSVHSSTPHLGSNAIAAMLPVLADLQCLYMEKRDTTPRGKGEGTTLAVTTIRGGSSENIVPHRCIATLDVRLAPGLSPNEVRHRIRACVGERAKITSLFTAGGIDTPCSLPLVRRLQAAIESEAGPLAAVTAPYATDCSLLAGRGPCVVWGPGDIAHAHKADEHIEISQIERGCRILCRFLGGGSSTAEDGPPPQER